MSEERKSELLRLIGSAIGICICLLALIAWRIPASGEQLGADVRVIATPPGELEVRPAGVVLNARGLKPGGDVATGSFEVRNILGRPADVQIRVLPSAPDLDRSLMLEFSSGGETIARGSAGELRAFGGAGLKLDAGAQRRIDVSARLDGRDDYAGRILDLTLEFGVQPR